MVNAMVGYTTIMMPTHSMVFPLSVVIVLLTSNSSGQPIATPSELFFVRLTYWAAAGGMMTRSACGRMTRR